MEDKVRGHKSGFSFDVRSEVGKVLEILARFLRGRLVHEDCEFEIAVELSE